MSFCISLQSERQPQNSTEMSWGVALQGFVFDQMTLIQLCGNQPLCRIPFGSWLWFQLMDMGRHVMWALCVTCYYCAFRLRHRWKPATDSHPVPKWNYALLDRPSLDMTQQVFLPTWHTTGGKKPHVNVLSCCGLLQGSSHWALDCDKLHLALVVSLYSSRCYDHACRKLWSF